MRCFFENHEIPYHLRCGNVVKLPVTNTTKYGINSLNFEGAMPCNIIPKNISGYIVIDVILGFIIFTSIGLVFIYVSFHLHNIRVKSNTISNHRLVSNLMTF